MTETRIITDEGFIREWLQTGTVVQAAVDNQKYFCAADRSTECQKDPTKTMKHFATDLGLLTASVGKKFPTINIMAELGTSAVRHIQRCGMDVDYVRYHAASLTVNPLPGTMPEDEIQTVTMDFFDPDYAQHAVHVKFGTCWEFNPDRTEFLRNKLDALNADKYFVHGVYGDICVGDFIQGVCDEAAVMVDPSLLWSYTHKRRMTAKEAAVQYADKGVLVTESGLGRRVLEKWRYDNENN